MHYMIRSRWTRLFYKDADIPYRKTEQTCFHKGDVLIVNNNLSYYKAEIQICLKDMENDGQRNRIGHISEDTFYVLNEMKPGNVFCFLKED